MRMLDSLNNYSFGIYRRTIEWKMKWEKVEDGHFNNFPLNISS